MTRISNSQQEVALGVQCLKRQTGSQRNTELKWIIYSLASLKLVILCCNIISTVTSLSSDRYTTSLSYKIFVYTSTKKNAQKMWRDGGKEKRADEKEQICTQMPAYLNRLTPFIYFYRIFTVMNVLKTHFLKKHLFKMTFQYSIS